jgi:hypothetical protein
VASLAGTIVSVADANLGRIAVAVSIVVITKTKLSRSTTTSSIDRTSEVSCSFVHGTI